MKTQNTVGSQDLLKPLSDVAWQSPLAFPRDCPNVYVGKPEKCRQFLSVVLWITKEGTTWRALPEGYGNWNGVYRCFSRWCDAGVEAHHEHFHDAGDIAEGYSYGYVIGDKAYDSDAFIAEITSQDAIAVIPPCQGRKEPRAYTDCHLPHMRQSLPEPNDIRKWRDCVRVAKIQ